MYTREHFRAVKKALKNQNGIFVMHSESPITSPLAYNCIIRTLRSVFGHVVPFYIYIQMYAVLWSIAVSSDSPQTARKKGAAVDARLRKNGMKRLHVFSGETFEAMRVAYPYIRDIEKKRGRIITDRRPRFPEKF
jgi:spermidine synthase